MNRRSGTVLAARAGQYVLLALFVVFLAFPLVWMLSVSLKGPQELVALNLSLIPANPTLDNFIAALTEQDLVQAAINSALVSTATAILTVIVALPAAYTLVRFPGKLQKVALGWILVSQVFPTILIVIPLFLILKQLGVLNNLTGLTLVYLVWSMPFVLYMLQSFIRAIPIELEEAAAVDGAGRIGVVRSIVFPLLAPGIVVVLLFAFIAAWNEFFFALVVLQSPDLTTIPVRLARFVGSEGVVRLGPLAAASLLATIPSLVVFIALQRRITSGLLAGGVKG
jgi:multiple sugar transport system permease protein